MAHQNPSSKPFARQLLVNLKPEGLVEVYETEPEQVQCHHRVAGPFVAEPIMDVLAWRTFVLSVLGLLTQSGVDLKAPQGPGQPGYKRS